MKEKCKMLFLQPKIRNILFWGLSFFLPFFLLVGAFGALKIEPFGNHTLLFGDANAYYINYLSYFSSILKGEHGVLYSFSKGMGGSLADFAWGYLLSPYTWLFAVSDWEEFAATFSWAVILMTSLAGLMMGALLKEIHGVRLSNLIFSTAYALCGFSVVNNYNIVFDMGIVLLPVVIMGLRRLWLGRNVLWYALPLSYALATGIQMGFVVGMASFLCMCAMLYAKKDDYPMPLKELAARFVCSSVGAVALSAVVWLPGILGLSGGRTDQTSLEDFVFTDNHPLLEIGSRMFSGASSAGQLIDGLPAIYCGILVPALVILFFLNKKIKKAEKTAAALLLGIYLLSFYIRTLTTVFQGFVGANWFNFRHSFVFSFLMILIAAKEFSYIDEVEMPKVLRAGVILFAFALIVFFKPYDYISGGMVVMDFVLLGLMGFGFWLYKTYPDRADGRALVLLFLVVTSFQLYANYFFSVSPILKAWQDQTDGVGEFSQAIFDKQPLVEGIMKADRDFYRIEDEHSRAGMPGNDPLMFHYNGLGQGNTGERMFVMENEAKLGLSFYGGGWNWYDKGTTASMDSFLGLKYILSKRDLAAEKGYELRMKGLDGTMIYENPYALPIAISSNVGIKDVKTSHMDDVFALQNALWSAMTGGNEPVFTREEELTFAVRNTTDELVLDAGEIALLPKVQSAKEEEPEGKKIPAKKGGSSSEEQSVMEEGAIVDEDEAKKEAYKPRIAFSFTAKQDGPVYFYDSSAFVEKYGTATDVLQYIGTYKAGEPVVGYIYFDAPVTKELLKVTADGLFVYYADMEQFEMYAKELRAREASVKKVSDHHLKGTVSSEDENGMLLFTIPYDKGWRLVVDGKEKKLYKTMDLFMAAKTGAGEHTYELIFSPVGMDVGGVISVLGLALLCGQMALFRRRETRINEVAALKMADIGENEISSICTKNHMKSQQNS